MAIISPNKITFLKTHPWQIGASKDKPEFKAFKVPLTNPDGTKKTLAVVPTGLSQDIDGHAAITFNPPLTIGGVKYPKLFVFMKDWDGLAELINAKVATASPLSPAGSTKLILPVTYRSQVDNADGGQGPGWRQCQLTSVTMLLEAWKGKAWLTEQSKGYAEPEEWYAKKLSAIGGDTTDPQAHIKVLNAMGFACSFRTDMGMQDAKETLDRALGMGFSLRYKSGGHICYLVGKDLVRGGLYVHDPYGKRDLTDTSALDTWEQIGGDGGANRYFNIAVVKDCWIDMGDTSGWGIWPEPSMVGHLFSKPSVTLPAADAGASITILQDTWLKKTLAAANTLPDTDKVAIKKDAVLECTVIGAKASHGQIKLPDGAEWWIFNAHFKGQESAAGMVASNAGRDFCVDAAKLRSTVGKLANPNVPAKELDDFCKALVEQASKYTITKREHLIHFLAQCFHESGGLMYLEELASGADYDDRDDLGNTLPEAIAAAQKAGTTTGRFYKGHSLIQTTGFSNHLAYGKVAGIDAVNNPMLLAEYPHALGAALYFWSSRGPTLSTDAEGGINDATCIKITKVVNGGTNGLDDRLHYMHGFDKTL